MRRILVPLDGSYLAEQVLPDARRLAGPDGELVLFRDVNWVRYDAETAHYNYHQALVEAKRYLDKLATKLRRQGVKVSMHRQTELDVAWSIDEAAREFGVDMIACATHGRGPFARFLSGGVVWKALTHSPVPVLVRHVHDSGEFQELSEPRQRHILVPLDGSKFAETALPLATELAAEWGAQLRLVHVVPESGTPNVPYFRLLEPAGGLIEEIAAREYLEKTVLTLPIEAVGSVLAGSPVAGCLEQAVTKWCITDVVMSSHGRSGLELAVIGSVADDIIHRLRCPVLVVPVRAAERILAPVDSAPAPASVR